VIQTTGASGNESIRIIVDFCPLSYIFVSLMPKRTYQPSKKKRMTTHGFLARKNSPKGSGVLKARRQKGRVRLAVKPSK